MTARRRVHGIPSRRRVQIRCLASLWICVAAMASGLEFPERVPVAPEEIVFSPPGGRFRVVLPAQPVVNKSTRRTLLGTIVEMRYVADIGDTRVAVEVYDLPHVAAILLPEGTILDRARDGLVEGAGGRAVATRDASHQGFPAREVSYELSGHPARLERALLVLMEPRLYIALATWPSASTLPPEAERLFETLEVWPP